MIMTLRQAIAYLWHSATTEFRAATPAPVSQIPKSGSVPVPPPPTVVDTETPLPALDEATDPTAAFWPLHAVGIEHLEVYDIGLAAANALATGRTVGWITLTTPGDQYNCWFSNGYRTAKTTKENLADARAWIVAQAAIPPAALPPRKTLTKVGA